MIFLIIFAAGLIYFYENAYGMRLTSLIRWIPSWLRYPLTVLAFYPTILYGRVFAFLSNRRRLWDTVFPKILCGVAPVLYSDVIQLHTKHEVRGIVNLCREWDSQRPLYEKLGIAQCYAPTTDFECPSLQDTIRCVKFMRDIINNGGSCYVHCKAGRGRSVCVVLAYLVIYEKLSPLEADGVIRAQRAHISKKWHLPLLTAVQKLAKGVDAGEGLEMVKAFSEQGEQPNLFYEGSQSFPETVNLRSASVMPLES